MATSITLTRLYLRASTEEQDANRARANLEAFAAERGLVVAATYSENESGASLQRPELFRLLRDSRPGDILLCEQVDRLSRLTSADWQKLRGLLDEKQVRVIALDLPTSWMLANTSGDEFTGRMFGAINSMMLDMLAAIARKDYDDRRRRQSQGIIKAKAAGAYKGRPVDKKLRGSIDELLDAKLSWSAIQRATGCGRATVAKVAAERRAAAS